MLVESNCWISRCDENVEGSWHVGNALLEVGLRDVHSPRLQSSKGKIIHKTPEHGVITSNRGTKATSVIH